jgi:uncharacterized protein
MADHPEMVPGGAESHLTHHGRVAYITIPARDPITSGVFYEAVFGWTLSPSEGDRVAWTLGPSDNDRVPFADAPDGLVGAFVAARGPAPDGVLLHLYVEDSEGILAEIEARGCEIVEPLRVEGRHRLARFRDPGGNVIGIWETSAV